MYNLQSYITASLSLSQQSLSLSSVNFLPSRFQHPIISIDVVSDDGEEGQAEGGADCGVTPHETIEKLSLGPSQEPGGPSLGPGHLGEDSAGAAQQAGGHTKTEHCSHPE